MHLTYVENRVYRTVLDSLSGDPDYVEPIRAHFDLILRMFVKFVSVRSNDQSMYHTYLAAFGKNTPPHESELQRDLFDWFSFAMFTTSVVAERPDVAGGRTDIHISFETFRFVVEVKRVLKDWPSEIAAYVGQTAAYQQTDVKLGFLAALDLTTREAGDPALECCFEPRLRAFSDLVQRRVVVCRIPGNREVPSEISKRKTATKTTGP